MQESRILFLRSGSSRTVHTKLTNMMRSLIAILISIVLCQVVAVSSLPAQSLVQVKSTQVAQGRIYTIESDFDSLSTRRWYTNPIDMSISDTTTSVVSLAYHFYSPVATDTLKMTIVGYMNLTSTSPPLADTLGTIHCVSSTGTDMNDITYTKSLSYADYPYYKVFFQRGVNAERDGRLQMTFYISGRKD